MTTVHCNLGASTNSKDQWLPQATEGTGVLTAMRALCTACLCRGRQLCSLCEPELTS